MISKGYAAIDELTKVVTKALKNYSLLRKPKIGHHSYNHRLIINFRSTTIYVIS